ncbi:ATP-binding cassette domain-containing protein [Nonomuraea sp. NPDC050556]|uniref:ATP-binding cassette domain-containing protein n=1 Tax=Nonomuraea sp. NPDC050556 TaxID=3364369 RepID=UPI0037A2A08C
MSNSLTMTPVLPALSVRSATVEVGRRVLLEQVSFDLPEGRLLAVVGPSGAGKTTLLRALSGRLKPSAGTVTVGGRPAAELRDTVGMVPQDDILHRQLTVGRALDYAARLRLPAGVDRASRISGALDQLGLAPVAGQRVSTLSGGQRKRVNVALELLTDPAVLFLDEPTSGLDPALDRDVMVHLRELTSTGRTVVVTTHNVLHLDVADYVLALAPGGRLAYFGPPDGLLDAFAATTYAQVFDRLGWWDITHTPTSGENVSGGTERRSREAPMTELFGELATGGPADGSASGASVAGVSGRPTPSGPAVVGGRPGWLRQVGVLAARAVRVVAADPALAAFLAALPVALALLAKAVPGADGLAAPTGTPTQEAQQLLVILIVGACFMGTASAVRELVGERRIYLREAHAGLRPSAYLASKLLVLAPITAAQSAAVVVLTLAGRQAPDKALLLGNGTLELAAVVFAVAYASACLGLLISALVSTEAQAMPVLVVAVMTQLVLCGGMFALTGRAGYEEAALLSPSRWAYAAAAGSVDLRSFMALPLDEPLWEHSRAAFVTAMAALAGAAAWLSGAAYLALARRAR